MDMIKNIPVHMDYVGQGRAEKLYQVLYHKLQLIHILFHLYQIIIVLFGVVGLGWGYTIQQFSQTVVEYLVALSNQVPFQPVSPRCTFLALVSCLPAC